MSLINNSQPITKITSDPKLLKLYNDLQGNILKSHARPEVNLILLRFTGDQDKVKNWIKSQVATNVVSMSSQLVNAVNFKNNRKHTDRGFMSFSLTHTGYRFLGINNLNDPSFMKGMKSGTISKDPAPIEWEESYNQMMHALVTLAHNDLNELMDLSSNFVKTLPNDVQVINQELGSALPGEKEHFGFADGRSQPKYFEEDMVNETTNVWNPFASLELVLVKDPNGKAFVGAEDEPIENLEGDHSFGSYLVFRKLEQDVDGWNKEVLSISNQTGISPDLVGAYAVGRFQDGTPVINHSNSSPEFPIENDFDYSQDSIGGKCPFHAHIRKSNPRGESPGGIDFDRDKVRITRRGIPYGNPEDEQKGLLFMCYQNSIEQQFDFMQNFWIDNDNFLHNGTGTDSTIGQGASSPKSWPNQHGQPNFTKLSFGQFVKMKGGEYFFTPSISFLASIV